MAFSARIGDIWTGICCCHVNPPCIPMTGFIITGSPNSKSGGIAQARLTDMTIGACGHPGIIVTASPNTLANSLGKARVGDQVTGCNIGTIVTGNPTHEVN